MCEPTCTDTDAFNYEHMESVQDGVDEYGWDNWVERATLGISDNCHCQGLTLDVGSYLPPSCEYEYTLKVVFAPSAMLYQNKPIGRLPICMADLIKTVDAELDGASHLAVVDVAGIRITTLVTEPALDPPKEEWDVEWRKTSIPQWVEANNSGEPRLAQWTPPQVD